MTTQMITPTIEVDLAHPFADGWNQIPGVTVQGAHLTISPDEYFFRYENPSWTLCDSSAVTRDVYPITETTATALEQQVLDYIVANGVRTTDPVSVIKTAEQVYSYVYRDEYLDDPELVELGVSLEHLRMLREMSTMMALNQVELNGHPSNVGPAWFFPAAVQKVYGITEEEGEFVDDLYHGGFFNENRRVESVKAHAALGGRMVHGCQASPCLSGGCVVPYGADIDAFMTELKQFKQGWISAILDT